MQPRNPAGTARAPDFLKAFHRPGLYDHPVRGIECIQTHISSVVLAGDFVYKFKKPVNFGFLDFSTLERRAHFCRREIELNRRLCPDMYLGVVRVTRSGSSYEINGAGEIVEYGVKMKRLPEHKMMSRLMGGGSLRKSHLSALITTLAPFYETAKSSTAIECLGTAGAVARNVLENLEQIRPFVNGPAISSNQFESIAVFSRALLEDSARFEARIAGGYIKDGHGDLHSGNICFAERVYVFDCIEFSERFRWVDVASDIAFIAMDLEFNGLARLSDYFMHGFADATGDRDIGHHVSFYKCYRACVRAKVNLLSTTDSTIGKQAAAAAAGRAAKYIELAESYVHE